MRRPGFRLARPMPRVVAAPPVQYPPAETVYTPPRRKQNARELSRAWYVFAACALALAALIAIELAFVPTYREAIDAHRQWHDAIDRAPTNR